MDIESYTHIVYADASDQGCITEKLGAVISGRSFTEQEADTSSNFGKLLAVKDVLVSLPSHLAHESALWYSDNINV